MSGRIRGFFAWELRCLLERVRQREHAAFREAGPAIIRPTGSPFDVKPHGIEIAGIPYKLNAPVFSSSGLLARPFLPA